MRYFRQKHRYLFIKYRSKELEGQCTLKTIEAIKVNYFKQFLFYLISFFLLGLPLVLTFWYIRFQRWCQYDYCKLQQATHFYILNYDNGRSIVKKQHGIIHTNQLDYSLRDYFMNRYLKYYFQDQEQYFTPIQYDYKPRLIKLLKQNNRISGLTQNQVQSLRETFGKCAIKLQIPNIFQLFLRQILQAYFLFLILSLILFYYEQSYFYASLLLFSYCITVFISLTQITTIYNKKFQMAYYETKIHAIRQDKVVEISSLEVLPGDLIFLKKSQRVICDGLLLNGSILINQYSLTGESIPVLKKGIDKNLFFNTGQVEKSNFIYEGTQMVQICSKNKSEQYMKFDQYGLLVYVIRTSFSTSKGQLIRVISVLKNKDVKFYFESAKFLTLLFGIGFISYLILLNRIISFATLQDIILRFFDLITITVQPAVPLCILIGIGYSVDKLKKNNIYCTESSKIIIGGRIDQICFDKTGTLTQQTMNLYEFLPSFKKKFYAPITKQNKNNKKKNNVPDLDKALRLAYYNMGTCHALMRLYDQKQIIGDPIEKALFQFTGYEIVFSQNISYLTKKIKQILFSFKDDFNSGAVYRRFEFSNEIRRMSIVAQIDEYPEKCIIFCKGAPESLFKIMQSETIPHNYQQKVNQYASAGYRILSIGYKFIDFTQYQTISREKAESNLIFSGLQVFQNELKPHTSQTIQTLNKILFDINIITGDNSLTAIHVGYKSKIIDDQSNVYICQIVENNVVKMNPFKTNNEYTQNIQSTFQKTKLSLLQSHIIIEQEHTNQQQLKCSLGQFPNIALELSKRKQTVYCISGQLFSKLMESKQITYETTKLFLNTKIFSRAQPNHKTKIIRYFQQIGKVVCMCGDGANDCGALKQADVGLALSNSQASISSAFSSSTMNISCLIDLLRECRGGLATNFSYFNVMAFFSFIQYTSTIICMYYYGLFQPYQQLYIDVFHNFIFILTIGMTESSEQITNQKPCQTLFSLSNIVSVFVLFSLQFVGQVMVIQAMSYQPFNTLIRYSENGGFVNDLVNYNKPPIGFTNQVPQVQVLFLYSNFIYLFGILAYSISKPWRKSKFTNMPFTILFIIMLVYDICLCLFPNTRLSILGFDEEHLPFKIDFQVFICAFGISTGLIIFAIQKYILETYFIKLREKYYDKHWI